MKTRFITIGLIVMTLACSKDNPVPAVPGCTISFKGVTHTLLVILCFESGTNSTVSASDTGGTKGFSIGRDTSDPTANSLTFILDTNDNTGESTYTAIAGFTSQPTITVSGKTWTFSGTAENPMADSGTLSGTCTCH